MKKILSILLIAAFLIVCVGNSAHARVGQSRIGLIRTVSTGIIIPHTHVRTSAGLIYRISFRANVARTWVAVIDSSTTGDTSSMAEHLGNIISVGNNPQILVDLSEATAGDYVSITYDPPLEFKNGLLVTYGATNTDGLNVAIGESDAGIDIATVIIHYGE